MIDAKILEESGMSLTFEVLCIILKKVLSATLSY
jgi:hypothetical protein